MFENLTDKLERSFKLIKGEGRITEINVAETLKEIRRALIDADVNYKVAKSFTDEVKQKALGQDVLKYIFFVLMLSVYLFIELNYYLRFNQCLNRPYI